MTTVVVPDFPAPARRLGPRGGLRNTFTLTWRSVLKIRTNMEDVLGLSLNPILFLILFTYVFGGAISGGTHAYLQFELPGILVLSVVFATLGTGLMLNQDIAGGVFDRSCSLPIAPLAPLACAVLGDMVRHVVLAAVALVRALRPAVRISATPPLGLAAYPLAHGSPLPLDLLFSRSVAMV